MQNLIYFVPGFITYVFLRPFGIFNFYDNFDRQLTLVILSLINSGVTYAIFKSENLWYSMMTSIVITLLYFVAFSYLPKVATAVSNCFNVPLFDNKSTMESTVSDAVSENKKVFAITFDFKNTFISSGYVRNVDNQGNYQIGLYSDDKETVYDVDDARELASNYKNTIITDFKNKTKTYLIVS